MDNRLLKASRVPVAWDVRARPFRTIEAIYGGKRSPTSPRTLKWELEWEGKGAHVTDGNKGKTKVLAELRALVWSGR